MPVPYPEKETYTVSDLLAIMAILRSPEGCPWDRAQSHESIRSEFLEETHEAIEAINQQDVAHLKEELGDVLLQVVFHTQIEQETGHFTFDDVVDGICKKMLVRHPHVFGDMAFADANEALRNWDAIKRRTQGAASQTDLLKSVPRSLPALMRAEKVQGRAARIGADFSGADAAWQALVRAEEAYAASHDSDKEQAMGHLLFLAVAVARLSGQDAEQLLSDETDRFIARFGRLEASLGDPQTELLSLSDEEKQARWEQAT